MSSRQISVVGKQTFTMNFATGSDTSVILGARTYDVRDAVSGVLLVRVAATSGMPTGAQFNVVMTNVLTMPDDPGNLYTPFNTPATASITVNALDANFPRLYTSGFTSASTNPCGAQVAFALVAHYGSAGGQGSITLAVDCIIRDA